VLLRELGDSLDEAVNAAAAVSAWSDFADRPTAAVVVFVAALLWLVRT
jgi:hypothetical protein